MLSIILLAVFCLSLLALLVAQHLWHHQVVSQLLEQQFQTLKSQQEEHTKSLKLMTTLNEKAQALVASSDPLVYQQIQAMNQTIDYSGYQEYDPSDDAEVDRITARNPNLAQGDSLDAQDARELFAELTGVNPEFYGN